MKRVYLLITILISICYSIAQPINWTPVEKVFGKKGMIQDGVFKITFPRTDLRVKIGEVTVEPGLALTTWIGFIKAENKTMGAMKMPEVMMMGDFFLTDKEETIVVAKMVSEGIEITAIHNHFIGEEPAIKDIHFSGMGDPIKLAESIKAVIQITGTPLVASPMQAQKVSPDWSKVEVILGVGKHNGNLLQYSIPRKEKLTDHGMVLPPFMGMATQINFQFEGNKVAIAGDYFMMADEVNQVIKALTENGITVTAVHNHMLMDDPRLFMAHFWAVDDGEKLAKGLKAALDKTNK